jgi:hypothetical protein
MTKEELIKEIDKAMQIIGKQMPLPTIILSESQIEYKKMFEAEGFKVYITNNALFPKNKILLINKGEYLYES